MTETEQLEKVKTALAIGGTYHDNTLLIYMQDVKEYLKSAGVSDAVIQSNQAIGVICRGVSDLWNYGNANVSFSPYFMQRAIQLKYCTAENEDNMIDNELLLSDGSVFCTSNGEIFVTA